MKLNMHIVDRIIRILIAGSLTTLYFMKVISGPLAITLLIISGIFVLTGLVGFCPIYKLIGISGYKKKY